MNVKSRNECDVRSITRIVCIMSYTSSASCLMSSLLDSHPNIISLPDNVVSDFQDFWDMNSSLSLDLLLEAFIVKYTIIFDARTTHKSLEGTAETGEARGFTTLGADRESYLEVDRSIFKSYMKEYIDEDLPVSRKLFFQAMHVAYSKALQREVSDPIIVFGLHSLTHPKRIKGLMEDFSDVYFLNMVRHPLRATASRFRRQVTHGISTSHFHRIISGVSRSGVTHPSTISDRWKAVRMEDLHSFPEQSMRHICHWLELPWDKVLLESTINGMKWWNEKQSMQISGFNTSISSQSFEEYLPMLDSIRLEILLGSKCTSWGYKIPWRNENPIIKLLILPFLFVPFKMEIIAWSNIMANIRQEEKSFIKKMWQYSRTLVGGFGLGRIALFRAWVQIIFRHQRNVPLGEWAKSLQLELQTNPSANFSAHNTKDVL